MPVSPLVLVAAWIITFAAAAVQGTIGFGFAVVSVPVLSLIDPALAPVPQLLVTMPLTLTMAWRERQAIEVRGLGWILAGRIPGAVIGVVLLKLATSRTLDVLIAVAVIGAVAVIAAGASVRRSPATEFAAGVASGASGLVASIGGPPVALLFRNDRGATVRSNLATIFSVGIAITVTSRVLAREITMTDVTVAALLFPALLLGYAASFRIAPRAEGAPIRTGILVVSAIAAIGLIARAVLA
jgi:uncharacterized membrane protein YfcA